MLQKIANVIDRLNETVGRYVSWLVLLMVCIAVLVVVLRYVFDIGFVWMQELYVWLHGVLFTVGAGYTLLHDKHVRVDVIYAERSDKYRRIINICGTVFLLLPMLAVIAWSSFPYVMKSWQSFESSYQVGGMKGVFVIKTMLLVFCGLLALQAVSTLIRSIQGGQNDS